MQTAKGLTGLMLVLLLATIGCGDAATESAPEGPQQLDSFDSELRLDQEWVGDLDGMEERGVVRALVAYSMGQYFLDGATQRGASYEALIEFEKFLNQRLGQRPVKVSVLIIPVQRDELLPALERGFGDIVEIADVEDVHLVAEVEVVETALWKTTVKWHLAAFESDAGSAARSCLLAFVALAGGLTTAGAFAATDSLDPVLGSRIRVV